MGWLWFMSGLLVGIIVTHWTRVERQWRAEQRRHQRNMAIIRGIKAGGEGE